MEEAKGLDRCVLKEEERLKCRGGERDDEEKGKEAWEENTQR